MNNYNNTIHKATKHTPYEVFYSNNQNLFNEIYTYTLDYRKLRGIPPIPSKMGVREPQKNFKKKNLNL